MNAAEARRQLAFVDKHASDAELALHAFDDAPTVELRREAAARFAAAVKRAGAHTDELRRELELIGPVRR